MLIPPKYYLNQKISQLLSSIESTKQILDSIPIPIEIENNIRRRSTLKSSLFSARIEGNPLTLDEVLKNPSNDQKRREVYNILKALNFIYSRPARDLSLKDILTIHQTVMAGLSPEAGKFRTGMEAIFNSAGIAIYLPPRPAQVVPLMQKLLKFINTSKEPFAPIKACLAHYIFEKIHPFVDGNGRVGRIVLQAVLAKSGYSMKGLLTIEEQLDRDRSGYYKSLEEVEKDVSDYLEFMLGAIEKSASELRAEVLSRKESEAEDFLLPRRAEILNIVKDHRLVNFDTIRRRFLSVNERTLRYDLKKLQDSGFIRKRGSTKGVYYEISH